MIQPGQLLISTPLLDEDYFSKTVVCITSCNSDGAMGFVINQPHPRRFNELVDYRQSKALPLYAGGPVETDQLYVLHGRPDCIEQSEPITPQLYLGGNFTQTVAAINNGTLQEQEIKLLIGYCGWDAGELEAEIAEGSWLLCKENITLALTQDINNLWDKLYTRHQ